MFLYSVCPLMAWSTRQAVNIPTDLKEMDETSPLKFGFNAFLGKSCKVRVRELDIQRESKTQNI
jgi:hypothetical protein